MRSTVLSTLSVPAVCLAAWLGLGATIEHRYGADSLGVVLLIICITIAFLAFCSRRVRAALLVWSPMFGFSALVSLCALAAIGHFMGEGVCEDLCFHVINDFMGYACGEAWRGCQAEQFVLSFMGALTVCALLRRGLTRA